MQKLRVLETFSGIGAQKKAISIINAKNKKEIFSVVSTCDWDARAIITYGAIHHDLCDNYEQILQKNNLTTNDELDSFLKKYNYSLNSKNRSTLQHKDYIFKKYLAAATIIANNEVDITKYNPKLIDKLKIDLITYSFPCQGLSVANMGRAKGINSNESTSSLIWQINRILDNAKRKPKYLLMENVRNLLSKKFKPEYEKWKLILKKYGYKTFTTTLNGLNHGSTQRRERVFALSVLDNIKTPFNTDEEYKEYLLNLGSKRKLSLESANKKIQEILSSSKQLEIEDSLINSTPSRKRMINIVKIIDKSTNVINTVTTKQDRIPNVGVIPYVTSKTTKLNYRFITNREAFLFMGFDNSDYEKLTNLYDKKILTKESMYRQAGNSIVVDCLVDIFDAIYKIEKTNNRRA
ncbi:DNA cytosine methyltransferase [Metamycoplasma equirhinis]|uniref:DNA cytosine methyltransferase n=1 Tax=Metamycoplasma equirhinis TaxID=92402 RepID=UPI003594352E